jgi:Tannase and feruloyl esterase
MRQVNRARSRCCAAIAVLTLLCSARSYAQPTAQFENWKDQTAPKAPKTSCAELRSLTGYEFSVAVALLVPAQAGAPEFCRVEGQILPEIRFEMSLPTAWNSRLYMFGNGGYAGESLGAGGRVARRNLAVAKGFAVAQTNTGHDGGREPLASFAGNSQKLIDYAYRAVHVTALTAKRLARAYYDAPPARSFFDGCSTGGRQGLISAQRFPEDFDGIIVGAPVLDFVGTMVHYSKMQQALASSPLSEDKVKLLAEQVYKKCDAVDSATDGLITDPRACKFDPTAELPRCAAASAGGCLSDGDVATLKAIYGDVVVNGKPVFPGFPIGAEAFAITPAGSRSGWDPWIIRSGQPSVSYLFSETFFKYMATPGTELDVKTFDADRDLAKLERISTLLNATNPDVSAFRKRGGKILMYFGWADAGLNPLMGLEYYERVQATMGPQTSEFFRLFMMPGVFHCAGGVGPDFVDTLTPLVDWVERGIAPDRIVASQRDGAKTKRTRPLCPHPMVAKYAGTGSLDDAASFTCASAGTSSR